MNKKPKVLIIAYAYEPGKSSEPGVGWYFAHQIAKFVDVAVLTRTNNKKEIEKIRENVNISYKYYDLPAFYTKQKKRIPLGIQVYFTLWQKGAYKFVKRTVKNESYDLIHHLTFGMTKMVPPAYKFDIPFLWGPIGGGDMIPFSFLKQMSLKAQLEELIYFLVHQISNYAPSSYFTRKRVKAILFRTHSALESFPRNGCKYRRVLSESAFNQKISDVKSKKTAEKMQILCVGRMIHGKGYDLALKGFIEFIEKGGKGNLIFLGAGPYETKLKTLAKKYNLEEEIKFKGFVPHDKVIAYLKQSHVLLHPSFREGGSWSIMEAMAYGLPVVCLNTSGPKDMVSKSCGILIDMKNPDQVSKDIGNGLMELYQKHDLYASLSENATKRIKTEYNWDKRGEQMKRIYQDILNF